MAANAALMESGENINQELVQQFCAITGATETVAIGLLEACNSNLELAIGMHMDNDGGNIAGGAEVGSDSSPLPASASNTASATSSSSNSLAGDSDFVRAPIPQKREVLVEAPQSYGVKRRRPARSVFDGFRDFQAEARQQQEAASTSKATGPPQQKKRKTLEDLFRPPIDIMQKGTFQSARDVGTANKKWLMVNIQNVQEFCCQVLNRDVWSNPSVKSLIRQHFIFWQVYHDSEEGQRFSQFYKCSEWPYIAILDPRTGEFLVSWSKIDATSFCDLVRIFLSEHPALDGESPSSETRTKQLVSIVDASEDSQMAAAIRASLEETTSPVASTQPSVIVESDSDSEPDSEVDLETFTDSDSEVPTPHKIRTSPSKKSTTCSSASSSGLVKRNLADSGSLDSLNNVISSCSASKAVQMSPKAEQTSGRTAQTSTLARDLSSRVPVYDQSSSDSVISVSSSSSMNNEKTPSWKKFLGKDEDCVTSLMIRLPCGKREQVKWPSTTKLKALILYVLDCGYSSDRYELVTNFPRRKISHMDYNDTLKDVGLHPQETVFVQERQTP
ncbi:UBX domain-containing protein 7-like isoform X3 [Tubulanus polymorphus]|uniref:UBX domain-containing protein 7-like isoform X3 n=1 Tax=Tubulanus polymorphus TaxID=672921 RepID=UPI003DA21649